MLFKEMLPRQGSGRANSALLCLGRQSSSFCTWVGASYFSPLKNNVATYSVSLKSNQPNLNALSKKKAKLGPKRLGQDLKGFG